MELEPHGVVPVADVLAAPTFGEGGGGCRGQTEGVVQLAVGEQAVVGRDPDAVELELQATLEGDPNRRQRSPNDLPGLITHVFEALRGFRQGSRQQV